MSTNPPPSWYSDPNDASKLRWWDGRNWSYHTLTLLENGCPGTLVNTSAQPMMSDYSYALATEQVTDNHNRNINIVLASYRPGNAAKQFGEVKLRIARCKSFSAKVLGSKKTVKLTSGAVTNTIAGEPAMTVNITAHGVGYSSTEVVLVSTGRSRVMVCGTGVGMQLASSRPVW